MQVSIAPTYINHTQRTLQEARQKLLCVETPMLVRLMSFLRLSCLASGVPGAYSDLTRDLFTYSPQWWNTCTITPEELLKSSDPKINERLAPVLALHRKLQPEQPYQDQPMVLAA